LCGEVVYIDRFGNLITNLTNRHMQEVRDVTKRTDPFIQVGGNTIEGLVRSYSEGMVDRPRALINSDGRLEIFIKEASASARLRVGRHETVAIV